MTDQEYSARKSSRLRQLFRILLLAILAWVIVTAYRILKPAAPLTLAREAVAAGQFKTAADHYVQHLARRPEDWDVRNELGLVLAEIDRPQALVELRKIPADSAAYPDACRQIVVICLASDRLQEAEKVLQDFIKRTPDDFWSQFTLAELYFRQSRPQMALPFAQKSTTLNPNDARAHALLAEILDDLNRTPEMIAPLERVLELQLDDYAAHLNLAYAYADAGQSAKSRREAEWCLARKPDDVAARRFLAQAARDEGKIDEAVREINKALAVSPDDLECRLLEGELLLFKNQSGEALQRLKPLYDHHSRDRRLAALLARAAAAAGQADEAAAYRQQVQKLSE